MKTTSVMNIVLGTTACVALQLGPTFAHAQEVEREGSCAELGLLAEGAGVAESQEFADILEVADANDTAVCTAYIVRVQDSTATADPAGEGETETEAFSASDTVTQTVEITQEAVVEGEVIVRVPNPDVAIEQAGPEIDVTQEAAQVSVDQAPITLRIRQAPAQIRVDMPQPTITIDQPAPEITIIMPEPGVDVANAQPQINVTMAEPTVTVTQGEPELDVQVEARLVDPNSTDPADTGEGNVTARSEPMEGNGTEANVTVSSGEPVLRMAEDNPEPQVNITQAEPQIEFEQSDPTVEVAYEGEPIVEVRQVGEPTVTIEQQEGAASDQAQLAADPAAEPEAAAQPEVEAEPEAAEPETAAAPEPAPREPLSAEDTNLMLGDPGATPRETEVMTIMASEIEGRDVLSASGDEIGDVARVVTNSGRTYLVVAHGGFLGIGESEVALPIERVALMGEDDVILMGLSEEDLEAMPEYDEANETPFGTDESFEMNNVNE